MAEEELSIQMEVFMQDSFLLINLMDKVTLSLPIKIPIRELFEMVRDRVMESIISAKGQFLKVTGIEILQGLVRDTIQGVLDLLCTVLEQSHLIMVHCQRRAFTLVKCFPKIDNGPYLAQSCGFWTNFW